MEQATTTFSKAQAIKTGWEITKANLWLLSGGFLVIWLISLVINSIGSSFEEGSLFFLAFVLLGWVVSSVLELGYIRLSLNLVDGAKATFSDIFGEGHLVVRYIVASILYALVVIAGFVLLVVPGVIWSIKYGQYKFLIVDQKLGPVEALKESARITTGFKWELLLLYLLFALINIAGALVLFVGLLVSIPVTFVAMLWVYRRLLSAHSQTVATETHPMETATEEQTQGQIATDVAASKSDNN